MAGGTGRVVKLKLYLEGIEIPIIGIQLQEAISNTPSCYINIGVNKYSQYLLPGTLGQVFYYIDNVPKLIFEGELLTITLARNSGSKFITLGFVGLTNAFDHAWVQSQDVTIESYNTANFLSVSKYNYNGLNRSNGEEDEDMSQPGDDIPQDWSKNEEPITMYNPSIAISSLLGNINAWIATYNWEDAVNPAEDLILKIFDEALTINSYLKILNKTLRLRDRIYVFPNSSIVKFLQSQLSNTIFSGGSASTPDTMSIKQIFSIVCDYIGYDWVELPAPCLVGGKPKSIIFKPKLDYTTPISCNMIYPSQVADMKYNIDFNKQPTRLFVVSPPLGVRLAGAQGLYGFNTTVAPSVAIKVYKGKYASDFTQEEAYKGIYPIVEQQPNYLEQIYAEQISSGTSNVSETVRLVGGVGSIYGEAIQDIVDRRFFELRSKSKTMSVTCAYNPYRMIGFPGAVLDWDLPHVVGTVVSISTSISAEGTATQSLEFANTIAITETYPDFAVEEAVTFPKYLSDIYQNSKVGFEYQKLVNSKVAKKGNGHASAILYYPATSSDGADNRAANETYRNYILRIALKYARIKYDNSGMDQTDYVFNHTHRELINETAYWEFLNLTNTDLSNNIRSVLALKEEEIDTRVSLGYPFVKERQTRVKKILPIGSAEYVP